MTSQVASGSSCSDVTLRCPSLAGQKTISENRPWQGNGVKTQLVPGTRFSTKMLMAGWE